jgi:tungstate transport system substrate-binding protein
MLEASTAFITRCVSSAEAILRLHFIQEPRMTMTPERSLFRIFQIIVAVVIVAAVASCSRDKGDKTLRLATTTSLQDSGLLYELLPAFEKRTGYRVEVKAVGSGKALAMLRGGEADVAITHAPEEEQRAIAAGEVGRRVVFMHNEFVIVGPEADASLVAGAGDFREVLKKIAGSGRKFISRGDGSGTHLREQALWREAGVAAGADFIVSAGAGMKATLERASKDGAFALTDRSTFLRHRDELDLAIVFQGDDELRNYYAVIEPAEKGSSAEQRDKARALADFVRSPDGRALIGRFGIETAKEPLFTPAE